MSKLLEELMLHDATMTANEAEAVPVIFSGFPRIALRPPVNLSDDDFLELCRQRFSVLNLLVYSTQAS